MTETTSVKFCQTAAKPKAGTVAEPLNRRR